MKKQYLLLLLAILCPSIFRAATFPTISTENETVWYYIQFLNGNCVLSANGEGNNVKTSALSGKEAVLWKIEGDASNGYTFTAKNGLRLYTTTTAKEGMFQSASAPAQNTKFNIVPTTNGTYTDGFEIQPWSNNAVSMNQWGGAGSGKDLGLWDKGDGNNPLRFVSRDEYVRENKQYPLIPYPASLETTREGRLPLNSLTAIACPSEELKVLARDFASQIEMTSGIQLAVVDGESARTAHTIHLRVDETLGKEAYTLTVLEDGIELTASQPAGFFYAVQTLKQFLPVAVHGTATVQDDDWSVPYVAIADEPLLSHRGYMLDIARHFFDKTEVKRILDLMAFYKMNRLHWHLTDDQGWRIEIPEYPRLTEVGSIRAGSFINAGDNQKFYDDTEYGRGLWYSLDDLKEIVAYAKERHIEILPEIDLPGHMVAAVTSYPEFSCNPSKKYEVRIDGGISNDVLNIGDDRVIDFLKCVLGHVAEVFPYPYIHLGGDECPTTQWSTNADCLARVQAEGLSGVNELQSWLVELLGEWLKNEHGKDIVVWDELLTHWNSDNKVQPVIMAWNNINKSSEAAAKGFKSIVVPYQSLYLDMMQIPVSEADVNEIYQGGWSDNHVNTLQTVYNVNPLAALSGKEEFCVGVQGNMWTETTHTVEQLEYQLLPRLLALAETGWLPQSKKDWNKFYLRLQEHDEIFDVRQFTYAKHYIEPAEQTASEKALQEAEEILAASVRGGVGYPTAAVYDALESARTALAGNENEPTLLETLLQAIETYKSAPVCQPEPGKLYQLVSASTYYKRKYAGSSVYVNGKTLRFHFTQQTEPEEVWTFEAQGNNGWMMKNYATGQYVVLGNYDTQTSLSAESGTALRIDKGTVANGVYTYVPGSVTLSAVEGYAATATGSVKRLYAKNSGIVFVYDDPTLCNPGMWRIVEVKDFRAQLEGLVRKCEHIVLLASERPDEAPNEEALTFLQKEVIAAAREALNATSIDEATYRTYVELYNRFVELNVPPTVVSTIDESKYYLIGNAYFTDKYAKADASNKVVKPAALVNGDDAFKWRFVKNPDGTVRIISKLTGTAAYLSQQAVDQDIQLGNTGTYANWELVEQTTDQSSTGIAIIEGSGTYSWYTNPSAFVNVLTKPYDWGASIWTLTKLNENVATGISQVDTDNARAKESTYHDLLGRTCREPARGIYIREHKKVMIQ